MTLRKSSLKNVSQDNIKIDEIRANPDQPRKYFNEESLKKLARSIGKKGLLQPILVMKGNNYYQIIHGERRWRAIKLLKRTFIEAKVIEEISNQEAFELSLTENIERDNLSPVEEALAFKKLIKNSKQSEIARRINKTRSYVSQKLRLLKLPKTVQELIVRKAISEAHARQLLKLEEIVDPYIKDNFKEFVRKLGSNQGLLREQKILSWGGYFQDYYGWQIVGYHWNVRKLTEEIDLMKHLIIKKATIRKDKFFTHNAICPFRLCIRKFNWSRDQDMDWFFEDCSKYNLFKSTM